MSFFDELRKNAAAEALAYINSVQKKQECKEDNENSSEIVYNSIDQYMDHLQSYVPVFNICGATNKHNSDLGINTRHKSALQE